MCDRVRDEFALLALGSRLAGDDDIEKTLKATKETAERSEIVSFVALSAFKKASETEEVDTESVYFSAAHNTIMANAVEAMRA